MNVSEQRRRHSRTSLDVDVLFTALGKRGPNARSRDISLGGMFVLTSMPAPFGTALLLQFVLPDQRDQLVIPAVVRWVKDVEGMGVQFGLLGVRETHAIMQYVVTRPTPRPGKLRAQR